MNQQYDIEAVDAEGFNWMMDNVVGILCTGATYGASDTRVSEAGANVLQTQPIQTWGPDENGDRRGTAVVFLMVESDTDYQILLAWEDGSGDPRLLVFFDESDGGTISIERRGSLIFRPYALDGNDPPEYGIWIKAEEEEED